MKFCCISEWFSIPFGSGNGCSQLGEVHFNSYKTRAEFVQVPVVPLWKRAPYPGALPPSRGLILELAKREGCLRLWSRGVPRVISLSPCIPVSQLVAEAWYCAGSVHF